MKMHYDWQKIWWNRTEPRRSRGGTEAGFAGSLAEFENPVRIAVDRNRSEPTGTAGGAARILQKPEGKSTFFFFRPSFN